MRGDFRDTYKRNIFFTERRSTSMAFLPVAPREWPWKVTFFHPPDRGFLATDLVFFSHCWTAFSSAASVIGFEFEVEIKRRVNYLPLTAL
jgi:hypothetical protein